MKKFRVLALPVIALVMGLSISVLQSPQSAYSQTDYEEYLIVETNIEQKLNQQNTGSGSSTNINCGTNIAGTNLQQQITCPSLPGETPTLIPVVTQRAVEVEVKPEQGTITEGQSPCNPDEVLTGGGYDVSDIALGPLSGGLSGITNLNAGLVIEEFAVNNAWHVKVSPVTIQEVPPRTILVFAECLKLIPS